VVERTRLRIIQGPDVHMPSPFGWPVRLLRGIILRLIQNFALYQRRVDEDLVEAIEELDRQVQELRSRGNDTDD
jgi:hypothetical protein